MDGSSHEAKGEHDAARDAVLAAHHCAVLRVRNEEVLRDLSTVLTRIRSALEARPSTSSLPLSRSSGEGAGGVRVAGARARARRSHASNPPISVPPSNSDSEPMPTLPVVDIHYRRLPDRVTVFRQVVVEDAGDYVVTFLEASDVAKPVTDGAGRTILEPGAPVVWFTYPGAWHDIGRFHLADGTFTGIYANVLMPVAMLPGAWDTTDLCLDVWLGTDGRLEVLDQDELEQARARGWIAPAAAQRALQEAVRLMGAARAGAWPPAHVGEWTLERARARVSGGGA